MAEEMLPTPRPSPEKVTQKLLHCTSNFLAEVVDLDDPTFHQFQILAENGLRTLSRRALHTRPR